MLTLCSVSASTFTTTIHLSILVPIHRSHAVWPGAGSEIQVRAKSAISVVDQDGNSIDVCIDRGLCQEYGRH
jgi:hypothetical protein